MRVVFMGTPDLAARILRSVAEAHDVVGVYTRPDAVRGRGNKLSASPVKQVAMDLGLKVFTPATLKGRQAVDDLKALEPDVVCVSAYGVILPQEILDVPPHGCLNVHASLLPRWRGAAPIERAILAGDELTGVCIMRMEAGLDTGDYCRRAEVKTGDSDSSELAEAISSIGARELLGAMDDIACGSVTWMPQSTDGVTYAHKIANEELLLDPKDTSAATIAKVRASSTGHPARAVVAGKTVSVERVASVMDDRGKQLCAGIYPGEVLFKAKRLFAGADDAPFELIRIKPDGKKSMDALSFASGIQGIKNKTLTWGRA